MKKAPNVKLSLRKLLVAMLAVGPVAILPSPVWAVLPTSSSYTVSNAAAGSVSLSQSGPNAVSITVPDRAILTWGQNGIGQGNSAFSGTNFQIAGGDTWNFNIPPGGSVLNKVSSGTANVGDAAAIINGTLIGSGRVYVLSTNGYISVGNGATINTAGGLVLSTVTEAGIADPINNYTINGSLQLNGTTSNGNVVLGGYSSAVNVVGDLAAYGSAVGSGIIGVTGNLILKSVASGSAIWLSNVPTGSAAVGPTTVVSGNLSVTTNNGPIAQSDPVSVGGTASLNAGTADITLTSPANLFATVEARGANVTLVDANDIVLGSSAVSNNLSVTAAGNISTSSAVAVTGTANLTSNGTGSISYATGSSAGTLSASTRNGTITVDTVGNLTLGSIAAGGSLKSITVTNAGAGYVANQTVSISGLNGNDTASGTVNADGSITITTVPGTGTYASLPSITLSGGGFSPTTAASLTAVLNPTGIANITVVGGGNYITAPTFTFAGGGGTGASAVAVVDAYNKVIGVTVTNAGSGYTSLPTLTIVGTPAGTVVINSTNIAAQVAPVFTVNLIPTTIASLTVANGGAGYTNNATYNNTATLLDNSTNSLYRPDGLQIQAAGRSSTGTQISGYLTTGTITVTSGAVPAQTISANQVGALQFTNQPYITVTGGGTAPTTTATVTANAGSAVSVASSGVLTTSNNIFGSQIDLRAPSMSTVAGVSVTGGTFTANATSGDLRIGGVTAPSINLITAANLSQASGVASVSYTNNTTYRVEANGNLPTLAFSGGSASSGATATGNFQFVSGNLALGGTVALQGVTITNAGSGYASAPTLTVVGSVIGTVAAPVFTVQTMGLRSPIAGQNFSFSANLIDLNSALNDLGSNARILVNATNAQITSNNGGGLRLGTSTVRQDLSLRSLGPITLGTNSGTLSETINVGGNLSATTTGLSATGVTVNTTHNATTLRGQVFSGNLRNVTVSFSDPAAGGTKAQGTVTFDASNRVSGITVTNAGSGYTAAPTVTLIGTGFTVTGNASSYTVNTTGARITDDPDVTMTVYGVLNMVTNNGDISLNSTVGSGRGYQQIGQFNANAGSGNVTLVERTTVGIGNVSANILSVRSTTGNIIFQPSNAPSLVTYIPSITAVSANANATGQGITQTTAITLGGGNSSFNSSTGTVLDNTSNSFGGNIQVSNSGSGANNVLVANSSMTLANSTSVTGTNRLSVQLVNNDIYNANARVLTVGQSSGGSMNATNVTLNSVGTVVINGGTFANLTVNAGNNRGDATSISQGTQAFTVNNTLTTSATSGAITLANGNNTFVNLVTNNAPGGTTLAAAGSVTLRGTTAGAVNVTAGETSPGSTANTAGNWAISVGNLSAGSASLTTKNGTANASTDGISGDITQQAGTTLRTEGAFSATTYGANVTLANAGNNFGAVTINTTSAALPSSSGNISVVERDTLRIGGLNTTGTITLTSSFGSIIEDSGSTVTNNGASLTATALNGSILLGNTTKTGTNITTGVIPVATLNAAGAAAIVTTGNLALGASKANSLSAQAGGELTQTGVLNVYGLTNLTSTGGNITLDNSGNNFGPVSVVLGSGAIGKSVTLVEGSSLNLRSVSYPASATGAFTATSVSGDIFDSGLGGVVPAGSTASPGQTGSGLVTLTATNGNIVIDDPTSDFATSSGVVFNARNVTLSVLGRSDLVLGAAGQTSTAAGNLTVSSATGSIMNAGALSATGLADFRTGLGNISVLQSANQFGQLKVQGNSVAVAQANDIKLLSSSSAIGNAQFSSGGGITLVNSGGSATFAGNVTFSATGNITVPKLLQASGTVTVNSAGTKDLSALSLSADLGNKAPVNFGSGTYVPPSP
jgi:hypothetical protein